MKNKKEIQEELEALAPSFSKMKKEEGFQVPENYFNDLPNQILEELNLTKEEVSVGEPTNWWTRIEESLMMLLQPRMAVGLASLILLVVSVFYFQDRGSSEAIPLAELTTSEAETYLLENLDEFEDELLYDLVLQNESTIENAENQQLDTYLEEIIDEMDDEMLEELL